MPSRLRGNDRPLGHALVIVARDHIERLLEHAAGSCQALLEHCGITFRDVNANSAVFFVGWGKHRWTPLGPQAQRPLAAARRAVAELEQSLRAATEVAASDRVSQIRDVLGAMSRVVDQSDDTAGAGVRDIETARQAVDASAERVREFVNMLPSAHGPGGRLLVPDTNAVIWQPDLTTWDIGPATLVLLPTVIVELDELKMRQGDVGLKAEKAIRVLNEMERRGDTFLGVKLSGRGRLRELPVDPPLPVRPPWLAADNADDRILAGALGIALDDLAADVVLVTRDRNMRNKARLAGLTVEDVTGFATRALPGRTTM